MGVNTSLLGSISSGRSRRGTSQFSGVTPGGNILLPSKERQQEHYRDRLSSFGGPDVFGDTYGDTQVGASTGGPSWDPASVWRGQNAPGFKERWVDPLFTQTSSSSPGVGRVSVPGEGGPQRVVPDRGAPGPKVIQDYLNPLSASLGMSPLAFLEKGGFPVWDQGPSRILEGQFQNLQEQGYTLEAAVPIIGGRLQALADSLRGSSPGGQQSSAPDTSSLALLDMLSMLGGGDLSLGSEWMDSAAQAGAAVPEEMRSSYASGMPLSIVESLYRGGPL